MLAKLKAALAWFRGLFTKGKTEMTDVVAATEAAVETALSTVETDVKAVVVAEPGSAGLAAASLIAPDGATVVQKTAPIMAGAAASIGYTVGANGGAGGIGFVSADVFATKIKDISDKLGIVLPAQWAQVVALAKVL
ncbi:hypothetical protein G6M02_08100 [Agrobacterium rhizogenes]|nr:hypothetical protein [Rhizobium rhizogenes]